MSQGAICKQYFGQILVVSVLAIPFEDYNLGSVEKFQRCFSVDYDASGLYIGSR